MGCLGRGKNETHHLCLQIAAQALLVKLCTADAPLCSVVTRDVHGVERLFTALVDVDDAALALVFADAEQGRRRDVRLLTPLQTQQAHLTTAVAVGRMVGCYDYWLN